MGLGDDVIGSLTTCNSMAWRYGSFVTSYANWCTNAL